MEEDTTGKEGGTRRLVGGALRKFIDFDDKDLAIIAVFWVAIGGLIVKVFIADFDAGALARDCVLVLGSVATGKALGREEA